MHSRSNSEVQDHYLYLSTPTTTPFTVTIKDGAGNILGTPILSNAAPVRFDIGSGTNTAVMVRKDSLNKALQTRGLLLSAPHEFYCNFRVRVSSHAASHTTKGTVALGQLFRYGAIPSSDTATLASRNFFLGMMATEDSTLVTITEYDTSVVFADPISDITDDTLSFLLNAGESYVISGYHGVGTNNYGFIGALITSDKPVVCNVGNLLGGLAPVNHDMAVEQIMPVDKIGNDYVLVAGRGSDILERPIVVAHYNNTQVFVNGNAVPEVVLNAGEFYVIPHARYVSGVHKNMYIQTTQPSYVYQVMAGSNSLATMGFMFIPPANCNLPNFVDKIPDIHLIGSVVFEGDVFVVTTVGASVTLNGVPLGGAQSVSGFPWVTYKLMNQTGHAHVVSTMPATIGFMGASGAAGYGSYYSGFHEYFATPPSNNIEVCQGDQLQLSVSGGVSYTWAGPNGFSSTLQNPVVANIPLSGSGQYYVTVTYNNGCEDVFISNVTVNPLPMPVAVSNAPVCFGNALQLNVEPFLIYSWSGPTGFSSSQQNPLINNVGFLHAGIYSVSVTDNKGCINSSQINVVVNPLPTISFFSTSPQCPGSNITFNATGGISYQWSGPSGFSSSNDVNTLNNVGATQMGFYSVTVTDNNTCVNNDSIYIVVNNNPQLTHSLQHNSCHGLSNGAITVYPFGGTFPYVYNWSTVPVQTSQTATGLSPNVSYTVVVSDQYGCITSENFILTQPPPLQITSLSLQDALCFNSNDGVAIVNVDGGTPPYSYSWLPAGTGGNTASISTLCAGTYQVNITDSNNCQVDTSFTIGHPDILSYTYSSDDVLCYAGHDGNITLSVNGGTEPYTYNWSPGVSSDSIASQLTVGTYHISITDAHQCDTSLQVNISQPPLLALNTSGNDTVCIGEIYSISAFATGGVAPYIFTWDNNLGTGQNLSLSGTLTTSYQVFATDSHNCVSDTLSFEVFVYPPVSVTAYYNSDSAICLNDSTQLGAIATGGNGGPYSFTWNQNIGNQNPPINVTPSQSTYFIVNALDNCGSPAGTDSIYVIVFPLPEVAFISDITEGCEPLTVNFSTQSISDIVSWQWFFGDPLSGNNNIADIQNPTHTYQEDGLYSVTLAVMSSHGCSGMLSKPSMILVHPRPTAAFNYTPQIISLDQPIVFFTDESIGASFLTWHFGDSDSGNLNMSNAPNTYHTYTEEGNYMVELYASSINGCLDTASALVTFLPEYTFYIPNAFTPNSDGINDSFGPLGLGIDLDTYALSIYDRWGKLTFYTNDVNEKWDGTSEASAHIVPADVYSWVITFVKTNDVDKHIYRRAGHVTLLR
ncbi:MAG: PKD domain-containing protein [Bacteroidales bacterium]|nr:PKD domain-containing protein [Bacteroidales bacterium]